MSGVSIELAQLLRFQRLVRQVNLPFLTGKLSQLTGQHASNIRGRSMDFDEFRIYQGGDDIRSIDWNVSARTGKTHVRVYKEERERPVNLVIDLGKTLQFGSQYNLKATTAAETAAVIAWKSLQLKDRTGGLIISDVANGGRSQKPSQGTHSVLKLLRQICGMSEQSLNAIGQDTNALYLDDALTHTCRLSRPGTLVCIISDFRAIGEEGWRRLTAIRRHCSVLAFYIYDPMEFMLPDADLLEISNGSQTSTLYADNQKYRTRFTQEQLSLYNNLKLRFRQLRTPFFPLTSAEETFRQLTQLSMFTADPMDITGNHNYQSGENWL